MHVAGIPLDLNLFIQFIFTSFFVAYGLLYLLKNTASNYFEVDASFEDSHHHPTTMPGLRIDDDSCVVCGARGIKMCSRCKDVRYCSQECQEKDWKSGHKTKCEVRHYGKTNYGSEASSSGRGSAEIALVPVNGTSGLVKPKKEILFPYDEFGKLYNWDKPGRPPCGLLNCGNSCYANVVLQCLSFTRPLVAYLLEKGHRRECRRDEWCFFCEFQIHVERAYRSLHPFSPINILSRLTNIGGNLGYGRQEDAHEFMRFAIDTMHSVCLDEFGGEKAVDPSSQETTLIQHTFGGHLQSQVICTKCSKISNQYENMMDLTVEIHGDVASLEECLDQFTVKEWLHGENMYKCDGCNEYVKAWKRLTVRRAPNILTIALKRFQSGRFGKLNKRVTFPETLDMSPYMSETGDGTDFYKLYSVVVHVDMLNASYFGHYICYTKDFRGYWYRIDDDKVTSVELEEVLSQGAYMLLYSRVCIRKSCLRSTEPLKVEQHMNKLEVEPCPVEQDERSMLESINSVGDSELIPCDKDACSKVSSSYGQESPVERCSDSERERFEDMDVVSLEASSSVLKEEGSIHERGSFAIKSQDSVEYQEGMDIVISNSTYSVTQEGYECADNDFEKGSCTAIDSEVREDAEKRDLLEYESSSSMPNDIIVHCNGYYNSTASGFLLSSNENGNEIKRAEMNANTLGPVTLSSAGNAASVNGKDAGIGTECEVVREDSEHMDTAKYAQLHSNGPTQEIATHGNMLMN